MYKIQASNRSQVTYRLTAPLMPKLHGMPFATSKHCTVETDRPAYHLMLAGKLYLGGYFRAAQHRQLGTTRPSLGILLRPNHWEQSVAGKQNSIDSQ